MQSNAKRSALGSQNPLHHDDTLQLILDLQVLATLSFWLL
jgi:hypothetical protein